jgi:putative oxidoreductase
MFISAGWAKLANLERVIGYFQSLGIPAPELLGPFVAATELSCGVLLVLGAATRFASVPLIITMCVAIRTAIWDELDGAIDLFGRVEWLVIALLLWLVIGGAGALSVDAFLARRLQRDTARTGPTTLPASPRARRAPLLP